MRSSNGAPDGFVDEDRKKLYQNLAKGGVYVDKGVMAALCADSSISAEECTKKLAQYVKGVGG